MVKENNSVSCEMALPRHWQMHNIFHVNLLKPQKDKVLSFGLGLRAVSWLQAPEEEHR